MVVKKISKEEMERILFKVDCDDHGQMFDPDDEKFTLEDLLRWNVIEFSGKGEFIFKGEDGLKYSLIVAPIQK